MLRAMSAPELELRIVRPRKKGTGYVSGITVTDDFVFATGGTYHRTTFLASSDGETFHVRTKAPTSGLREHYAVSSDRVVAVGEYGFIGVTEDQGESWRDLTERKGGCLYCIVEAANGDLLVGGDSGVLLRSSDRGETWEEVHRGGGRLLGGFADGRRTFFFGDGLRVWDGATLSKVSLEASAPLCGMTRAGEHLILVGDGAQIFRSSDGARWEPRRAPASADFESIAPVAGGVVVVGGGSTLLYTEDEGASFEVPTLDHPKGAHYWTVAPCGSGAFLGCESSMVLRLEVAGDEDPFAGREDVFTSDAPKPRRAVEVEDDDDDPFGDEED